MPYRIVSSIRSLHMNDGLYGGSSPLLVPLPGGNQTFTDIISVILSAGGVPVTSALMLVAERLLRTVYRGSHEGVRGLVYLLANIQQQLPPVGMAVSLRRHSMIGCIIQAVPVYLSFIVEVVIAISLWELGDHIAYHTAEVVEVLPRVDLSSTGIPLFMLDVNRLLSCYLQG